MHTPIALSAIPGHVMIVAMASLPAAGRPGDSTFREVDVPALGKVRLWFAVDTDPHKWVAMFAEVV